MKSILNTLSPSAIETLIAWCQSHKYAEVRQLAARPIAEGGLALDISEPTLHRLYATHNIADSKETRAAYLESLGLTGKKSRRNPAQAFLYATRENLSQRLLEMTANPNATAADLRLAAQVVHRTDSIALAQRRVQVAEHREARITKLTEPPKPQTIEEVNQRIDILLGKDFGKDLDKDPEPKIQQYQSINETHLASQITENLPQTQTRTSIDAQKLPPHNSHSSQSSQSAISNLKSEIPAPLQSQIVNHHSSIVNESAEFAAHSDTPPSEKSAIRIPQSAIIPTLHLPTHIPDQIPLHILAHAERSYPSRLRPFHPADAQQWDWAKDHCIQSRLKFERESAEKQKPKETANP